MEVLEIYGASDFHKTSFQMDIPFEFCAEMVGNQWRPSEVLSNWRQDNVDPAVPMCLFHFLSEIGARCRWFLFSIGTMSSF